MDQFGMPARRPMPGLLDSALGRIQQPGQGIGGLGQGMGPKPRPGFPGLGGSGPMDVGFGSFMGHPTGGGIQLGMGQHGPQGGIGNPMLSMPGAPQPAPVAPIQPLQPPAPRRFPQGMTVNGKGTY